MLMPGLRMKSTCSPSFVITLALFASVAAAALVSCGGGNDSMSSMLTSGMGSMTVTISDPPSCAFPNGDFEHVFITIRSVQAHTSATATDSTPGWQELVPQLNTEPVQVDLFALGNGACLLKTLGSNTALPAATFQQIRLLLVANDGSTGAVPASNACGNQGFNCVVLHDGSTHELQLSSEANTGLKIPPGQIVGGPITVQPGQDVDLNIDFNACASIVHEGNGDFRLKPTLTAGQVSANSTGISGSVVDSATNMPIAGGTVLVALEQPDNTGTDVIMMQAAADSGGNFNFCPLPSGTFDVVVVAINGAGVAYNATVAIGVPGGTALGAVPLVAETGSSTGPATFQGVVTATNGMAPIMIDASVAALQSVNTASGARLVTIPAEGNSTQAISVESNSGCPTSAPMNADCAQYTLIVPASNPSVGVFSGGKISYGAPASGDVLYSIRANAAMPLSGGSPDCTPASQTTSLDSVGNPLKATAGATVTPKELDFSGCS